MDTNGVMFRCDLCNNEFQFSPHRYDGKHIPRYQVTVCMSCWNGNWDGWAPHLEQRLISHLNRNVLPIPERNSKGWLPRD
jgi:hypothetical protein